MHLVSAVAVALQFFTAHAAPLVELNISVPDGRLVPLHWDPERQDVAIAVRDFAKNHGMEDPLGGTEPEMSFEYHAELRLRLIRASRGANPLSGSFGPPPRRSGLPIKNVSVISRDAVIAVFEGHDANIAISVDGRVQCILEMERLFGKRYYMPPKDKQAFREAWLKSLVVVRDQCECEDGPCPRQFDVGVVVMPSTQVVRGLVEEVFVVKKWKSVEHAEAHAFMAYHASPFRSALVVTNDAGFNMFYASLGTLEHLGDLDFSLGVMFMVLSGLLPEVTGKSDSEIDQMCRWDGIGNLFSEWNSLNGSLAPLGWAGKLMGYAATGKPTPGWGSIVRELFEVSGAMPKFRAEEIFGLGQGKTRLPQQFYELLQSVCSSREAQRSLAASIQEEFEVLTHRVVMGLVEHVGRKRLDGIVLTGGCALNVLTNQHIHDTLSFGLTSGGVGSGTGGGDKVGVWVPPSPNDGGLSVGGLWAVTPPAAQQPLQYLGFHLWDSESLKGAAQERNAQYLPDLGGIEYVADVLAGGPSWHAKSLGNYSKPIVALVRGRQEFGPRALGHRSLLAVPDSDEMRDRMNRLKARRWYRPVAPMIAEEALEEVFGHRVHSPYMTMAPQVREQVRTRFPGLTHLDGTARHQSVAKNDEPWVHELLVAVGRRTGLAALINTSFNTKGKPIVNSVGDSLDMLDSLPDLDALVIDDWIFWKA